MSHRHDQINAVESAKTGNDDIKKQLADINSKVAESDATLASAVSTLSDSLKTAGTPRFLGPLADGTIKEYSYDSTAGYVVRSIQSVDADDSTPAPVVPTPEPTPAPEPTPVDPIVTV